MRKSRGPSPTHTAARCLDFQPRLVYLGTRSGGSGVGIVTCVAGAAADGVEITSKSLVAPPVFETRRKLELVTFLLESSVIAALDGRGVVRKFFFSFFQFDLTSCFSYLSCLH